MAEPLIPAEAVQAAADADRKVRCTHTLGSSCAECRALASLVAAAPFLAEHIAARLRSEANRGPFTAPALQRLTYVGGLRRAARLARETFPGVVPSNGE